MDNYTELIRNYESAPRKMFGDNLFWSGVERTAERTFELMAFKAMYDMGFIGDFCALNYRAEYVDHSMGGEYTSFLKSFIQRLKAEDDLFREFWGHMIESTEGYAQWLKSQSGDWEIKREGKLKFSDMPFIRMESTSKVLLEAYTTYRGGKLGENY
jgi:hypothetical protein